MSDFLTKRDTLQRVEKLVSSLPEYPSIEPVVDDSYWGVSKYTGMRRASPYVVTDDGNVGSQEWELSTNVMLITPCDHRGLNSDLLVTLQYERSYRLELARRLVGLSEVQYEFELASDGGIDEVLFGINYPGSQYNLYSLENPIDHGVCWDSGGLIQLPRVLVPIQNIIVAGDGRSLVATLEEIMKLGLTREDLLQSLFIPHGPMGHNWMAELRSQLDLRDPEILETFKIIVSLASRKNILEDGFFGMTQIGKEGNPFYRFNPGAKRFIDFLVKKGYLDADKNIDLSKLSGSIDFRKLEDIRNAFNSMPKGFNMADPRSRIPAKIHFV